MKLQKIGGVASIGNACVAAMFLFIAAVVFPRLGLMAPQDWMDAAKAAQAATASPLTFFLLDIVGSILFAIAFLLIMLALRERMQADAPILTQMALVVTPIACALWLAAGLVVHMMRAVVGPGDTSFYKAAMGIYWGLTDSGDHAAGWALLLMGWAALRTAKLPRILGYLIVLVGVVTILDFLSMALGMVSLALMVIMPVWLGIVLLRTKN